MTSFFTRSQSLGSVFFAVAAIAGPVRSGSVRNVMPRKTFPGNNASGFAGGGAGSIGFAHDRLHNQP